MVYQVVGLTVRVRGYDLPLHAHLPLHLCGASTLLGAVMLYLRSYRLYEIVYFWGTGGALAALATPDLAAGFPHPLFLLFFIGHGLSLIAPMFATIVWGFRPKWTSLAVALAATALYALLIYPVNLVLGSNYLFLMRKPDQPTLLDSFGPWPWYILALGASTVLICVLCYLPFAVIDWRRPARNMHSSA